MDKVTEHLDITAQEACECGGKGLGWGAGIGDGSPGWRHTGDGF